MYVHRPWRRSLLRTTYASSGIEPMQIVVVEIMFKSSDTSIHAKCFTAIEMNEPRTGNESSSKKCEPKPLRMQLLDNDGIK